MKVVFLEGKHNAVYLILGGIEDIDPNLYLASGLQIRVGATFLDFAFDKPEYEIYFTKEPNGRKRCLFPVICREKNLDFDGKEVIVASCSGTFSYLSSQEFYEGKMFKEYQ